ncbi:uncharacterized protein DI49_0073 [Saccharomyces eubayanus]|uniref:uncharacterized protein n=1 Tax=Saccharomyces eubayanus TaxID=1080349 RepID=UPI0006BFE9CA|nr:hypothetical protein DI49_0073 [Saccharomyces eubayanus]KOH01404.1 hypothetical protein DI49_0073 [Saccharomyces eubayanus]
MNQYLYDRGYWRTPYRFYSKSKCYDYFKKLMKWNVSYTHPDSPNSIGRNSQATGASFRFGMDPTGSTGLLERGVSRHRSTLKEAFLHI